jgi:hypothetical protein
MIVGPLLRNAPVIGSCCGFVKTAVKVYNSTTPSGAIKIAVKGLVLDCTPPVIKYPALCAALAACCIATVTTGGNPLAMSATVTIAEAIVECSLGY